MRRNILNNYTMENRRRDPMYATMLTDLALTGLVDKAKAEQLLGYAIPGCLRLPSWYTDADTAATIKASAATTTDTNTNANANAAPVVDADVTIDAPDTGTPDAE